MHNQNIPGYTIILVITISLLGIIFFPVIADFTYTQEKSSQIAKPDTYTGHLSSEISNVTLFIQQQGFSGTCNKKIDVSHYKAKELQQSLKKLEEQLINENWEGALHILSQLKQEEILSTDSIDSLIYHFQTFLKYQFFDNESFLGNSINLFCLVFGNGNGFFSFPFDTALSFFFIWIIVGISILTGDFIDFVTALLLGPIYSILLSHVFPRLLLLSVPFYLETGTFTTIGLKGIKTLDENSSYNLYGFTGVIINFVPSLDDLLDPQDPLFFCIGTSSLILPTQKKL